MTGSSWCSRTREPSAYAFSAKRKKRRPPARSEKGSVNSIGNSGACMDSPARDARTASRILGSPRVKKQFLRKKKAATQAEVPSREVEHGTLHDARPF